MDEIGILTSLESLALSITRNRYVSSFSVVKGGIAMLIFLIFHNQRGKRVIKYDILSIWDGHGNSADGKSAISRLNTSADRVKNAFWLWVLSNLRVHNPKFVHSITMWQSFFLKSRGLSWAGMDALYRQGIVVQRHALTSRRLSVREARKAGLQSAARSRQGRRCWPLARQPSGLDAGRQEPKSAY